MPDCESVPRPRCPAAAFTPVVLLLLAVCAGCDRAPRTEVIGYAYGDALQGSAVVAQDELDETAPPGEDLRILGGSAVRGGAAEDEVRRAMHLLGLEGLVGVVGHGGSRGSLVAAPLYNEAGVPQIVPTGTSSAIAAAGPWTFALAPDDDRLAARMVAFARDRLGARTATLCYISDEYGYGLEEALRRECDRQGLRVADAFPFTQDSDLGVLTGLSLDAGVPDVVLAVGRDRAVGALVREFSARAPGLRFVAGDGVAFTDAYRAAAGSARDSLYAVTFWHHSRPDSLSRAFATRYRRVTGRTPGPNEAMRHDALMLMARAVRAAGGDRQAIRDWLAGLGREHPPYRGVTGEITFGPDRRTSLVLVRCRADSVALVREEAPGGR